MYLKRLEITGFKSFAGRSVLDFEKEGQIAAIVGPNGSGKSNIADAIRWVLGEQSYKSLRSKKSEDVIFSGSGGKAKGSMAKVAMVLDNSDGRAPIDFNEVQISRSVFRDGSGEYMIAGKKARLLDIAELLAKSGFGQSTYSVIGQGMVDSMLFYGPAERKVLFDEAAGVRQYELKREQTLKKLEDTAGNVIRIKDILAELNPRLNTLRRQAEKAKEKDQVTADLLEKQKVYFSTIWDRITVQEKEKRIALEKLTAEEAELTAEIAALNQQFNESLSVEKADNTGSSSLEKEITELEESKDELRQQIFTLRAKLELSTNTLTKKEITAQIKKIQEQQAEIKLAEKQVELEKLGSQIAAHSKEEVQAQIAALEEEKDAVRQRIYQLRASLEVQEGELSAAEIKEKQAAIQAEVSTLDDRHLQNQKAQHQAEAQKIQAALEKLEAEVAAKKTKLDALQQEFSSFDFGTVAEKVGTILYLQNDFVIQIESAKKIEEVHSAVAAGKKVSERLKELRTQVGDVKNGRISGITELQKNLEALSAEKEELTANLNRHQSEVLKVDFEIAKTGDKKFELEKELGRLERLKPAEASQRAKTEAEIQKLQTEIAAFDQKIADCRAGLDAVATLNSRRQHLEYEIQIATEREAETSAEIARLEKLKPAEATERVAIESEIQKLQTEVAAYDKKISAARQELNQKSQDFRLQSKKLTEIKDALSSKQHLYSEYSNSISNLRVELARFDTKKQDIREDIIHDLGSEAVLADAKIVTELDVDLAKSEIEKLRSKLYAIGEIDGEVEGEFAEVSERVAFMSEQVADLEKAKDDLEKLTAELDGKIKKQFEGAFSAISAKFTHFFEVLFDGGEAKLSLVRTKADEDGPEDSTENSTDRFGIEITAIPPGKRVQNISALSGGERTMTSLALLFAILSVNPAPFCVLDEVDAALDESNTKRFLKIVEELAPKTQFIFITHNRETMKPANVIYGITMDETHASRLLSVRLEEALATAKK